MIPGLETSKVVAFEFKKVNSMALVTAPTQHFLPKAKVGVPYKFQFKSNIKRGAVWNQTGHLMAAYDARRKKWTFESGLTMDKETGVLWGVPKKVGAFTIQVQVAQGFGQPADGRTYTLVVEE